MSDGRPDDEVSGAGADDERTPDGDAAEQAPARRAWWRRPPPDDIGSGDDPEPYQRRVAVVLALLAVMGAWIGILHSDAATNESRYARETTRTAISSLRANVNQSTVEGLEVDLDAEQDALALAGPFRDDGTGLAGLLDSAEGDAETDEDLDAAEAEIAGLDREALAREQNLEAARLDLQRQALAETRVTWNNRASQYETVLTTLGIALFLVGFTLVLRRRTRPPILVPGILLAVYVAGWALWIHHRDVPSASDEVIEATAQGDTDLAFGDVQAAIERYDDAIAIDDGYEPAYRGRSFASFQAANPDFARTLAVVDTDSELADQARADVDEAISLGEDEFQALLLSGAYAFYDGDFERAVERLEAAVEANPQGAEAWALLAAAQVGAGDTDAVRGSIDTLTGLLDASEASGETRQVAADLLSFLEVLRQDPDVADAEVAQLEERVAQAEAALAFSDEPAGELPDEGSVALESLRLDDDQLSLDLTYEDLPEDTEVQIYLFEQPAEGADLVQSAELSRFARLSGSGEVSGTTTIERACTPVAFRLDVYLDGAFAESFDAPGGDATC